MPGTPATTPRPHEKSPGGSARNHRNHHPQIRLGASRLKARLFETDDTLSQDARLIEACFSLLQDPYTLYRACNDDQRRLLNQALFAKPYIHEDHIVDYELNEPFATLHAVQDADRRAGSSARPPSARPGQNRKMQSNKAAPTTGNGLFLALLEGFNPDMDLARVSNKPNRVGTNGANYKAKELVTAIQRLLKVLPDHTRARPRPPTPATTTTRRLTTAERTRMVEEYQQGMGTIHLAKLYGVSRETVRATLRRAGLPQHERGLTPEQIDQAVHLHATGESLARIGKRFNVDAHTVWRRLLERDVAMR